MEVIQGLENVTPNGHSMITVGSFDGLHLGHQRIIRQMRKQGDGLVTVMTFDPHPQSVVRPDQEAPPQLTGFEEKLALFSSMRVDRVIIARFDKKFMRITPEEFIRDILIDKLSMRHIFVGPKHAFGAGRKGNVDLLNDMSQQHGFSVSVIPPLIRDGVRISSTRIRRTLLDGDAWRAFRYLGRPYYIEGTVVVGDKRGRSLGFPTANLKVENAAKLKPPEGVYATITEVGGVRFRSVSHLGARPTIDGAAPTVETHIFDFDDDIYGENIRVGIIEKIRDIRAFGSLEELVSQIKADSSLARSVLDKHGFSEFARFRKQRIGKI